MRLSLNPFHRARIDHRSTGYWIALLLTLLVLLNVCGVLIYAKAHPQQGGWEAVWSYLESDTSKLLSASLVFPLLIFVVEGRFNLVETIRAGRSERRRRAQDEKREARRQSIEQTSEIWSRITDWVGGVVYWDGSDDLRDSLKESWKLKVAAEDVLNGWTRFRNTVDWSGPGSATELEGHFLRLVNALMTCTQSTICYLQETSDPAEREDLQTSLVFIANGIDDAVHHPLRNVLYASLELMDIIESEDPEELRYLSSDEEAAARRQHLEETIDENIAMIAVWAAFVKDSLDSAGVLPTASGDEADVLRSSLTDDDATLREKYLAVPRSERLRAWRTDFTRAWLVDFADEMAFQLFSADIKGG